MPNDHPMLVMSVKAFAEKTGLVVGFPMTHANNPFSIPRQAPRASLGMSWSISPSHSIGVSETRVRILGGRSHEAVERRTEAIRLGVWGLQSLTGSTVIFRNRKKIEQETQLDFTLHEDGSISVRPPALSIVGLIKPVTRVAPTVEDLIQAVGVAAVERHLRSYPGNRPHPGRDRRVG